MTREEYNDISAALDRIMKRVADDETLPQKAAIGAVGVLGGFQLFIKEYYEKHSTATPQGLDETPKKRLRKVCNLREDLKDEPIEEKLQELREIRAEKNRLDEPRDCGKGIHKQEYTGCDMSWMGEWKYASPALDEAAEEYAMQKIGYADKEMAESSYAKHNKLKVTYFSGYDLAEAFDAGAKWMAEQGVVAEITIDEFSPELYNKCVDFGLTSEDKVIVQIRRK